MLTTDSSSPAAGGAPPPDGEPADHHGMSPGTEGAPRPGRPRPGDPPYPATVPVPWSATRIAAVLLVSALVLAVGYAAGRAGTPTPAPVAAAAAPAAHLYHDPGGLLISQYGYTLELDTPDLAAGRATELSFRILGPTGEPLTEYRTSHERLMHLVFVARDLTDYQHVHPELGPDGTWRVEVTPAAAGPYRAFADFWPTDLPQALTLGVDLPVPGRYAPQPVPPSEETILVDGYTVTLDGGLRAGESTDLLIWLGLDGEPVTDLELHLGAYGHLVALRDGDLAYLHVHPAPASEPSSVVAFSVQVPSAGMYRMFFEFRHRGVVRVAEFTVPAF